MIKPLMQDSADGKSAEIVLEGVISSDSWWGDEYTPEQMRNELAKQANGRPITVIINSPGGEVFAGAAIYNALMAYDGEVTVRVDGVAASMASVIAMAGDKILMSPGSIMMVHRPLVLAQGNAKELSKAIDMLEEIEDSIIPIYEKRTGLSKDEVFTLLDDETWMSADKAVELGFADSVVGDEPNAFAKIKAMITTEKFSFSMSIHDSLVDYVAKNEVEPETPAEEAETEETTETVEEVIVTPDVEADDTADEPEAEEVTEPIAPEIKEPVEEENMNPNDKLAQDAIVPAIGEMPVAPIAKAQGITVRDAKKMVVDAFAAAYKKDKETFDTVSNELSAKMLIDGSNTELFGSQVFATDIREAYLKVGRVGQLVNRIDIEGAESFKILVEAAVTAFAPTALGGVKGMDTPEWVPVTWSPQEWSKIVPWLDGVQKRSPIAVYNTIVRYIVRSLALTEDTIVLTFAGGTFGGEVFPATGLVPLLTTAGRVHAIASYDADDLIPELGDAYGAVETDLPLSIVCNRKTWGKLATSMDDFGRPIFTMVGDQVTAGALGTFTRIESQVLEDGDVIFGALGDYTLVTRGAVEYLFSREATVPNGESTLNLFTQNGSAVRAALEIVGKPERNASFVLLQFPASS